MAEDKNNNETSKSPILDDSWMIRPCTVYEDEYSECTSIKARFHQYFIYGESLDCTQWKRDCDNCYRWQERQDIKSGKELIESEKLRRRQRLSNHYNNTVWPRRRSPPENWNTPLPEYLTKEYEHSYLNIKAKEMRGEIPTSVDPNNYCTIM